MSWELQYLITAKEQDGQHTETTPLNLNTPTSKCLQEHP